MGVSFKTFCIFVSTNHIAMATINEGNYKIKELVPGYYTHVEEDEGGDSYSGVYRSSDNQKVIDDFFYVLKEIREGLFYGRNYKGDSFLFCDDFSERYKISSVHFDMYLPFFEEFNFDDVSAEPLQEDILYNCPSIYGYELLLLTGFINGRKLYGCFQLRRSPEYSSSLVVSPYFDELLFSEYFISCRREDTQNSRNKWWFFPFAPSFPVSYRSIRGIHIPRVIDRVPDNVDIQVFCVSEEKPLSPEEAYKYEYYPKKCYPVPLDEKGYYVIGKRADVTLVDHVVEITEHFDFIVEKGGKYGLCGSGTLKIDYDERIKHIYRGLYLVGKSGKMGVFDLESHSFIINLVFDTIEPVAIDCWADIRFEFIVSVSEQYGVLGEEGEMVVPLSFNSIEALSYYKKSEVCVCESTVYKCRRDRQYCLYGLLDGFYNDIRFFAVKAGAYCDDHIYLGLLLDDGWRIVDKDFHYLTEDVFDAIDFDKTANCFVYRKGDRMGTIPLRDSSK